MWHRLEFGEPVQRYWWQGCDFRNTAKGTLFRVFDLMGNILILTGPPGAGKTTTARSLAAASGAPAVHLHSDDFWHFIKKGAIPPYLHEAHKQNEVVIAVLAQAAEGYAKGLLCRCGRNRWALVHSSIQKAEVASALHHPSPTALTSRLNAAAYGAATRSVIQKRSTSCISSFPC